MSDRATLKGFFETNDFPTQGQFEDFIDQVPNIPDDYDSKPVFTRFIKASFTAAEVRALFTTPQSLVAAPGAGFAIEVSTASVRLNFTAPVFATNPALMFTHTSANSAQMQVPSILNATVSVFRRANFVTFFFGDVIEVVEDEALLLATASDIVTGGSSLDVYVAYRIITL